MYTPVVDQYVHAGGGPVAAGIAGLGPVVGQQHDDLRVIRRGEAHEGDDDPPLLRLRGLGGAGLAADAVARLVGVLAAAARGGDHALQDGPAAVAGLLADHLAHQGGLGGLDLGPAGVGHRLDHIGLVQVAPVDDGGEGGDHLQGGNGEALAEGGHRQVHIGHGLPAPVQADLLSGQINARRLGHAEGLEVVVELLHPQPLADLDEGGVAGVLHRLGQGLHPVALPLGAVDGVAHPGQAVGAGAVEGVVLIHHPLLQGGGQHQGLEGGAGLIGWSRAHRVPSGPCSATGSPGRRKWPGSGPAAGAPRR